MRFRRISFSNYRCFLSGDVRFQETGDKNINLFLGLNGSGKTELLFAFWWVLYDYDFGRLRGKESSPYALNSDIYKQLVNAPFGTKRSCSVEVEIEYDSNIYLVKKTCDYVAKTGSKVDSTSIQTISTIDVNGGVSLPIHDEKRVKNIISKIIPESVLHGILFDGERMEALSSNDEKSQKAISGVIQDITNVLLIQKTTQYLEAAKKELLNTLKQITYKNRDHRSTAEIVENIQLLENTIKTKTEQLEKYKSELKNVEARLIMISKQLQDNIAAKNLETQRIEIKKQIAKYDSYRDELYDDLKYELVDGYLIVSETLFEDILAIIESYDVPNDLTVQAVKSILQRDSCICGRCLDEAARSKLMALIDLLPPDNINSTLKEAIRQLKFRAKDVKTQIQNTYLKIKNNDVAEQSAKDTFAQISNEIETLEGGIDQKLAKDLERENQEKISRRAILQHQISTTKEDKDKAENDLYDSKKALTFLMDTEDKQKLLNKKIRYVENFLSALIKIQKINRSSAIASINKRIDEAYIQLSEDAPAGRRVRMLRCKRNALVAYNINDLNKTNRLWSQNGMTAKYRASGTSDSDIYEKMIDSVSLPNSTGQSKMNTLAFVKAVLDYSSSKKSTDDIEIQKEYPLMIDAPFSDLAGDNLKNAATYLPTFSKQIILMLDPDRYDDTKQYLQEHVSTCYEFRKIPNYNRSEICLKG